jgi:outer membrane receptor for ferrienterochelin and colicin
LIGYASLTVLALCLSAASAGAQNQSSSASASGTSASATPQTPPVTPPAVTAPATKAPAAAAEQKGAGDAPADETVVTITAPKPEVTHKADRDVYDVKQDPISATGSVSDVLNNIPAVTADPDGTVSLRGNTNVQIYVNGKKQSQMQGDARAFTLQSLPGADVDSIEVLTNPPASFGSDTSGGIINIVLKRGKSLRPQTYLSVTAGDEGKGAVGGAIGKAWGPLTVTASGTFSQNSGGGGGGGGFGGGGGGGGVKSRMFSDRIRLDPTTGAALREDETSSVTKNKSQNRRFDLNANYNINDSDSLAAALSFSSRRGTSDSAQEIKSYDGVHNLTSARAQLTESSRPSDDMSVSVTYDARGEIGTSDDFKMQWQHSQTWAT